MNALTVELAGEITEIGHDEELTFGRDADLVVDTNPYLHRRLGTFQHRDGVWWLVNTGSAIPLEVCDAASASKMTVTSGNATALPYQRCIVRFQAGPSIYELAVDVSAVPRLDVGTSDPAGPLTISAADIPLNIEQRQLLVALAEPRLRDRAAPSSELPTNRQVAARLGWTITKLNRKLDHLCVKFERAGVRGLRGDMSGLASNRRERLIEHVLTTGVIGTDDLIALDDETS